MITNDILKKALRFTGKVGVLASEEEDRPVSHLAVSFCTFLPESMCLIFWLTLFLKVDVVARGKEVVYDEGSKYVTVFDPLDGSSNVDAGIPTGESHQFCINFV